MEVIAAVDPTLDQYAAAGAQAGERAVHYYLQHLESKPARPCTLEVACSVWTDDAGKACLHMKGKGATNGALQAWLDAYSRALQTEIWLKLFGAAPAFDPANQVSRDQP